MRDATTLSPEQSNASRLGEMLGHASVELHNPRAASHLVLVCRRVKLEEAACGRCHHVADGAQLRPGLNYEEPSCATGYRKD